MDNIILWGVIAGVFIFISVIITIVLRALDKQKIKAYIVTADRKVVIIKRKPINNQIEYNGGLYDIDSENYVINKNRVVYFYDFKDPKPLNPYTRKVSKFNPREYYDAIKSKVIRDVVATQEGVFGSIGKEIIFFIIIGVIILVVAYLGNEKLNGLQEQINNIIKLLGGL